MRSSSEPSLAVFANCLPGLEVDQMHLATGETGHGFVAIGLIAGCFNDDKAVHSRCRDRAAIEKWWHSVSAPGVILLCRVSDIIPKAGGSSSPGNSLGRRDYRP